MTISTRMRTSRIAAAGLVGVVVLAVGASAAAAPASPAPVIDPDATGSLTVHKFGVPLDGTVGTPGDGTEIVGGLPDYDPLDGVDFTLYQVQGLDLTDNDDWVLAAALEATFDPATVLPGSDPTTAGSYALGAGVVATTGEDGEDGQAVFDDLAPALYLVVESETPAGYTPVPSFMVTVPLTVSPTTGDQYWEYDVHVYPKNPTFTPTKTVLDAVDVDTDVDGEQITYSIRSTIPAVGLDAYRVIDELDAALTFDAANPDHFSVSVVPEPTQPEDPEPVPLVTLVPGTDVTVGVEDDEVAETQTLEINILGSGLTKVIGAAQPGALISVEITVTVDEVGEISNTASVYPNQAAITNDLPTQVAVAVESKWGTITIDKASSDSTVSDLSGATFELYYTNSDEWDGNPGAGVTPVLVGDDAVTTDGTGDVSIAPLRYSDFANGAAITPVSPDYRYYWLREVVALDDHELLAAPVAVVIADTAGTDPVTAVSEITNVPSNAGFQLPFTGGMGTVWFTVAGVLLIGGATLLLLRQRRSRA